MDSNVWTVRTFKKLKPIAEIPETLDFITPFLPSPSNCLFPTSRNDQHGSLHTTPLVLGSPFNTSGSLGGSSSQPRLIKPPQSDVQKLSSKFEWMETFLKDLGFDSVGEFLKILFYNPSHTSGESDPWGSCHAKAISRFLQGRNKIKMSDIISLIYKHKHSAPQVFVILQKHKNRYWECYWFSITSCSTAENALSVQNGSNKLQLDHMQSVHPIRYEFLDDGFDHIKAFRVLPVGLLSHHWVIIEDSWSVKM